MQTIKSSNANFSKNKNQADCMNRVHSYINETAPKLIERFKKGVRVNADNSIFKKHKESLDGILGDSRRLRAYLSIGDYSIYLSVDDNYQDRQADRNGVSGCSYYKQTTYVYDRQGQKVYDFEPLKADYTEADITRIKAEIDQKEDEARELGYTVSKLKIELGQ